MGFLHCISLFELDKCHTPVMLEFVSSFVLLRVPVRFYRRYFVVVFQYDRHMARILFCSWSLL